MTNEIAIRDDMKSVERWENEGGRVSPLNNIWASLKGFTTKDNYREAQMIDAQQRLKYESELFSGFNVGRELLIPTKLIWSKSP